jgi:hypothetical protein
MKFKNLYSLVFLIFPLIISCREEIIEPNNPAGNVNQPIRFEKENYFNIDLNAYKLSTEILFDLYFTSQNNQILIKVSDLISGKLGVRVLASDDKYLYSASFIIGGINTVSRMYLGIPAKMKLNFDNFTGKLKIIIGKI